MRNIIATLTLLLWASATTAAPYDICFNDACFVIETDMEIDEVVTSSTQSNGDMEINIAGVYIAVLCEDIDNDGADDKCDIAVSDEEIPQAGTVLSSTCSGTTLLTQMTDGLGGTYTNSQMNSTQCGYVASDDDPCYNGSWYVGQGNPECEDVRDFDYKKYCIVKDANGNYGLATAENCSGQ